MYFKIIISLRRAVTKMMYLLGKYEDIKLVKIGLTKNLVGELTK